ncbi:hypothetical protein C1645_818359, partial [Glomus cerebriforme]
MDKVDKKMVKRKTWKIRNINYIERLLDLMKRKNIFWSLKECTKKGKLKSIDQIGELKSEIVDINEIEELIPVNRYSLYWNRKLVNDQISETVKKFNKLKYLGDWLTLKLNKKLITNLGKKEINWEKTIEYIKNYREGGMTITSDKDRRDRSYNIKNLIEQLPTYKVMTRRNEEIYDVKCPRCNKEEETWMHIWQCEANEIKIQDIIQDEIDINIKALQQKNIKINREKWHQRILEILIQRSNYIEGGYMYHEVIKGIFNRKLYEMELPKQIKLKMESFITNIARKARELIWNKRCDQVTDLEKKR